MVWTKLSHVPANVAIFPKKHVRKDSKTVMLTSTLPQQSGRSLHTGSADTPGLDFLRTHVFLWF